MLWCSIRANARQYFLFYHNQIIWYLHSVKQAKEVLEYDILCGKHQQTKQPRDSKKRKKDYQWLEGRSRVEEKWVVNKWSSLGRNASTVRVRD